MIKKSLLAIMVFVVGIIAGTLISGSVQSGSDLQVTDGDSYEIKATPLEKLLTLDTSPDVNSPKDRISEQQILVTKEKVVINMQGAEWASFTDTNSMDPVLDAGANAIEVIPQTPDEIEVGDIVVYNSEYAEGSIIHRVIYKGEDADGVFFVLKGDNNPKPDPGKVRFSQITRVVVAIIY